MTNQRIICALLSGLLVLLASSPSMAGTEDDIHRGSGRERKEFSDSDGKEPEETEGAGTH